MTIEEFKQALSKLIAEATLNGLALGSLKEALDDEATAVEGELMRARGREGEGGEEGGDRS